MTDTKTPEAVAPATAPAATPIIGPEPAPFKTAEEMYKELKSTPFFMTEPDPEAAAAFQALAYEGTPLENASEFKAQGNEQFKMKRWGDAREFYNKGIDVLVVEEGKRAQGEVTRDPDTGVVDSEGVIAEQRGLLESLYANRAACQLEMKNYRATWLDAGAGLRLNGRNVKCWYRSAKALLAVDRLDDAADAAARGLAVDGGNASLRQVVVGIEERRRILADRERAEGERRERERRRGELVRVALAARGIKVRKSERPPEMGDDARVRLAGDEDDARSGLVIPTMLLYPTDYESDFIKGWNELETIEEHLGYILPLPWDGEGRYTMDGVECYAETVSGGLMKLGKKLSLLRILSGGKVEVVDEMMKIFVVPKAKAEGWVAEYKAAKAKQTGK